MVTNIGIYCSLTLYSQLDVYNALIPDGSNWKATFMTEYNDVEERKQALGKMLGIDNIVWVRVGDCDPVHPIANEDVDRETEDNFGLAFHVI